MSQKIVFPFLLFVALCLAGFAPVGFADERFPDSDIQWLLDQYQVSEPISLIPAEGLAGWTTHEGTEKPRWSNQEGKLVLAPADRSRHIPEGDLLVAKQYTNFVLDFVWVVTQGGNSGIKYRLKDYGEAGAKVNNKTFTWLGYEYQILDDANNVEGNKGDGRWSTASLYWVLPPDKTKKRLNPHGVANAGRIVVLDNHVEHWLNGEKVLQYEVGSETWKQAIEQSKFAQAEGFGKNPTGFIMVQDHGDAVTYERIVIREIGDKKN